MKSKKKKPTSHKVAKLQYNINNFDDYKKITSMVATKDYVYKNLVKAVKSGVENKVDTIEIFKIIDSNVSIILPKDRWKVSLNSAMEFFTEKEMFEFCSECKKLLEKI